MDEEVKKIVKKADMGLVGAIIVASQILSSMQSTKNISDELQHSREEFNQYRMERESLRKEDMKIVMDKLDEISKHLARVDRRVKDITLEDSQYSEDRSSVQGHETLGFLSLPPGEL